MLLSSVIIILREVLEAALLFSIFIALSRQLGFDFKWVAWSLFLGLIGAMIYGLNIDAVSQWYDGVGQEVTNALMQLGIYLMLLLYMLLLSITLFSTGRPNSINHKKTLKPALVFIMIIVSTLAITREGAEVILYFFSVTRSENHLVAVLTGMTIGGSIGISIGFLFYYFLSSLNFKWSIIIGLSLMIMVAAAMVSQASLLLIQADWLPSQLPLWDTSGWLSERSAIGQLMYALIGYEATPTAIQAGLYLCGFIVPILLILGLKFKYNLYP